MDWLRTRLHRYSRDEARLALVTEWRRPLWYQFDIRIVHRIQRWRMRIKERRLVMVTHGRADDRIVRRDRCTKQHMHYIAREVDSSNRGASNYVAQYPRPDDEQSN